MNKGSRCRSFLDVNHISLRMPLGSVLVVCSGQSIVPSSFSLVMRLPCACLSRLKNRDLLLAVGIQLRQYRDSGICL
jgi:hypothetical protein